jgi:rhomboid protease GluP
MMVRLLLRSPLSFCIALAILATWCASAVYLDQSILAVQKSRWLIQVGAVNGDLLSDGEWWRLLTSQFLHVHFLHMIFNAVFVFLIGGCIERRYQWRVLGLVYVVGGTIGQIVSVLSYPALVSSGASQALMALCGASVILLSQPRSRMILLVVIAIQVALDIYAAWTIKYGHCAGFGAGLFIGLVVFFFRPRLAIDRR